jgi:hypothetical protein
MTPNEQKLRKFISNEIKTVIKESIRPRRTLASLIFEADEKKDDSAATTLDISKGPSAAISFLNGPGADKRVRALLAAGTEDGSTEDESAKITEGSAVIANLIPTQVEIELTKSIGYPLAKFDALKNMIAGGVQRIGPSGNDMIVTSGNLIVDGHHRWSSLFSVAGPGGEIASINVELQETDAASVLAIVQTAIASTLDGAVPAAKAGGMNILGKSEKEIAGLIRKAYESGQGEAGPVLADEFVEKCLQDDGVVKHFGLEKVKGSFGIASVADAKTESLIREKVELNRKALAAARQIIINKVANNLSKMNQPAEGSPPRVDMPQLDKAGGGVMGALDKLSSGEVNYKEPFKNKTPVKKESSSNEGEVLIERWQRLAGIVK